MGYDCDVVVIGSGAGGGTFAYGCARQGKDVMLLERGPRPTLTGQGHDERAMLIDKKPYDDRPVQLNGHARRLYMGSGLGGSTSVYGAALMRPSAEDFHPGHHYGHRIPRAIWDWPLSYHDLEPHYGEAERLYGVAGCADDDFGPLQKPRQPFPQSSIPLKPVNQRLMEKNRARGLKPFQLPLAIDFNRCLQCNACPGYLCVNGARSSSAHLVTRAEVQNLPLRTLTGMDVDCFVKDGRGQVSGVSLRDRATGQRSTVRARRYVLAAGAIGSPHLLRLSGLGGPLVGRHYMVHVAPVVLGIFRNGTSADQTYVKQVGFADYYFGSQGYAHKLGLVQSLPAPGPHMLAKATRGRLPLVVIKLLRKHMLPLCGIVEDLPSPTNRVSLSGDGQVALHHKFAPYDLDRGRQLLRLMKRILRNAGAMFCLTQLLAPQEHVGHQCGTVRFGKDPAHAVVDPDCRMFDQPNVFVVDASIFPTSLGVGPALTVIANALRVARVVAAEV